MNASVGERHGQSVSTTVIETVAARENVNPIELNPSLYEVVDPDALDALFAPSRTGTARLGGRIEFSYCGYELVVRGDGNVTVTDPTEPAVIDAHRAGSAGDSMVGNNARERTVMDSDE